MYERSLELESSIGKSVEETYREFDAHLRYTTFWKRFFASIIDGIFLTVAVLICQVFMNESTQEVVFTFIPFVYSILMHGHSGQTIGKQFTGIQVVNFKDEKAINYLQAFKRDAIPLLALIIMYVLSSYLPANEAEINPESLLYISISILGASHAIWYVLEFITMLLNKKRRAIHDFIASTVVIRT